MSTVTKDAIRTAERARTAAAQRVADAEQHVRDAHREAAEVQGENARLEAARRRDERRVSVYGRLAPRI